jgi:hypothetical protein
MFGAPERQPDQSFFIPIAKNTHNDQIRVIITAEGITPTLEFQPVFQTLQRQILDELVKNRQLYKSPPTLESLQCMTPTWGFIKVGNEIQQSKSTIIRNNIPASQWPCIADCVLDGIKISRSLIQPVFSLVFVETVSTAENVIDFDWGVSDSGSDLQEVSDVSFMPTASGDMRIKDAATREREKMEAKERVRAAYRTAEAAREAANTLASQFYSAYDVSDNESAFSEWADLDSEDDDSDGASR